MHVVSLTFHDGWRSGCGTDGAYTIGPILLLVVASAYDLVIRRRIEPTHRETRKQTTNYEVDRITSPHPHTAFPHSQRHITSRHKK